MAFISNALGTPNQYRTWLPDRIGYVNTAHNPEGGKLPCHPVTAGTDQYTDVHHTHDQAVQVLLDYNKWDLDNG